MLDSTRVVSLISISFSYYFVGKIEEEKKKKMIKPVIVVNLSQVVKNQRDSSDQMSIQLSTTTHNNFIIDQSNVKIIGFDRLMKFTSQPVLAPVN